MAELKVHPFYRIWFTIVDPAVLVLTVFACLFAPSVILETSIPASLAPYDPLSHGPLLYQSAALYAFMAIIFGVLLRVSNDLKVWRIVQFATFVVDCSLLVVLWTMLGQQGRLEAKYWRSGDLFNAGFTVWVAVIRAGFLAGFGVGENSKKGKRG